MIDTEGDGALGADSVVLVRDGVEVTRAQFRAECLASVPPSYSPLLHAVAPGVFGIGAAAFALAQLRAPDAIDAWFVPLVFMAANALEWRLHKDVLHRPSRGLEALYEQHTPVHHRIFMTDDMAIRDARELRFVLGPPYAILVVLGLVAPLALLGHRAGQHDVACLFFAASALYAVAYEWVHVAVHLPEASVVGRLFVVRALRRHHAVHHDPRLMHAWNLNVTVPLWDWVRGTVRHERK